MLLILKCLNERITFRTFFNLKNQKRGEILFYTIPMMHIPKITLFIKKEKKRKIKKTFYTLSAPGNLYSAVKNKK